MSENPTIFQAFEWYLPGPSDNPSETRSSHYTLLATLIPHFAALGITHIWLPPGCKAQSVHDNGYAIYDLWDLGEFDAKSDGNSSRTKWGSKDQLLALCETARSYGIGVLWDAVLNHKAAADAKEPSWGVKVDPHGTSCTLNRVSSSKLILEQTGQSMCRSRTSWRRGPSSHFRAEARDTPTWNGIGRTSLVLIMIHGRRTMEYSSSLAKGNAAIGLMM